LPDINRFDELLKVLTLPWVRYKKTCHGGR